jgi:hypothetical protein
MMINVYVGSDFRALQDADQHWLCNEINGRRHDGQPVCVRVRVKEGPLDMTLSTPGCAGGGGGRAPNDQEAKVFDLWKNLHLNEVGFSCGNVHAFLVQLRRLL